MSSSSARSIGKPITTQPMGSGARIGTATKRNGRPPSTATWLARGWRASSAATRCSTAVSAIAPPPSCTARTTKPVSTQAPISAPMRALWLSSTESSVSTSPVATASRKP